MCDRNRASTAGSTPGLSASPGDREGVVKDACRTAGLGGHAGPVGATGAMGPGRCRGTGGQNAATCQVGTALENQPCWLLCPCRVAWGQWLLLQATVKSRGTYKWANYVGVLYSCSLWFFCTPSANEGTFCAHHISEQGQVGHWFCQRERQPCSVLGSFCTVPSMAVYICSMVVWIAQISGQNNSWKLCGV